MAAELGCFDLLLDDDLFFDFDPSIVSDPPLAEDLIQSSPDSENSWIGDIESQLMNDDDNQEQQKFPELDEQSVSEFLADLFVDYPANDSGPFDIAAAEVLYLPTVESPSTGSNSDGSVNGKEPESSDDSGKEKAGSLVEKKSDALTDSGSENQDGAKVESEIDGDDDATAKKRRRQVRNRDAAVRSRERKKEYVTDLEKKSKYLERECMRLGRILECFAAENHSLRLCLQKGSGNASMVSRQESAVLLLESLLLGSLLWHLGNIIYQFPYQPQTTKSCSQSVEAADEQPEKLVLSGLESSNKVSNTENSRRCKGSRPRMKHQIVILVA
uniref:BZIP transcription factor 60 n=1 Tax=Noccaea caerulescens TaxID=107243 RepID=A0A1J3K9M4_NOCCA